jgi:23S rRNA (adenine2030-N6)-methyltransferase
MSHYDHRVHAGNAGDVWKHFLLLEAADCLLDIDGSLVYAESHVGRPEYALRAPGDWEGGIGKIRPLLPSLGKFCYFNILADLNPESTSFVPSRESVFGSVPVQISRPILYPGSARLIYELAKRKRTNLQADVWDNDSCVAGSWESFTEAAAAKSAGAFLPAKIVFHQGDGFLGVLSILHRSPPGLLFIDPPYIDPQDVRLARKLLQRAKDLGWIVLWWYMMDTDTKTAPDDLQTFGLQFAEAGLDGERWKGAVVAFAGAKNKCFDILLSHMHRRIETFIRILKSD